MTEIILAVLVLLAISPGIIYAAGRVIKTPGWIHYLLPAGLITACILLTALSLFFNETHSVLSFLAASSGNFNLELSVASSAHGNIAVMIILLNLLAILLYSDKEKTTGYLQIVLIFLGTASVVGISISANLVTVLIFSVLVTFSAFLLILKDGTKLRAFKFLAFGVAGDLAMLAGIVILFTLAKSLDFKEIQNLAFEGKLGGSKLYAAGICIMFAVTAKTAILPLHFWAVDDSKSSFKTNSILQSVTFVPAGIVTFLNVWTIIPHYVLVVFGFIAVLGALYFALAAASRSDMKRSLAYVTASHASLILALVCSGLFICAMLYFAATVFSRTAFAIGNNEISQRKMKNKSSFNYWLIFTSALSAAGVPFSLIFLSQVFIYYFGIIHINRVYGLNYAVFAGVIISSISFSYIAFRSLFSVNYKSFKQKFQFSRENLLFICAVALPVILSVFIFYSLDPSNPAEGWFINFLFGSNIVLMLRENVVLFYPIILVAIFAPWAGIMIAYWMTLKKISMNKYLAMLTIADVFVNRYVEKVISPKEAESQSKFSEFIIRILGSSGVRFCAGLTLLVIVIFYFIFGSI